MRITCAIAFAFAVTSALSGCDRGEFGSIDATSQTIEPARVHDVVERIALEVERDYLDRQKGKEAAASLRAALARGEYEDLDRTGTLAARLTGDLRKLTGDLHMLVFMEQQRSPHAVFRAITPGLIELTSGIERVDRLRGNIGYIKLTLFSAPHLFEPAADAAIRLLQQTDALIIDVRDVPGGDARSVAYLTSFFFDSVTPRLMRTIHLDGDSQPLEIWSRKVPRPYLNRRIYILTSALTGSGAEMFAYDMQLLRLATVVGERSGGSAHTGHIVSIDQDFRLLVPSGYSVSAISKGDWEGSGITPDHQTTARVALVTAVGDYAAYAAERTRDELWKETLRQLAADVDEHGEAALFTYVPFSLQAVIDLTKRSAGSP